jgi:hypothetical protein
MLRSAGEVRARIDQLRLSHDGYSKQLGRSVGSEERRERLQVEVASLADEMKTLETLLSVLRVEEDMEKVEVVVRDRLAHVRERLSESGQEGMEGGSGEARALLWALGEDSFTASAQEAGGARRGPAGAVEALPSILLSGLVSGTDPDARAYAAYELGVLHVTEAIPHLVDALAYRKPIHETALLALAHFSDEELEAAGVSPDVLKRIREARQSS